MSSEHDRLHELLLVLRVGKREVEIRLRRQSERSQVPAKWADEESQSSGLWVLYRVEARLLTGPPAAGPRFARDDTANLTRRQLVVPRQPRACRSSARLDYFIRVFHAFATAR